MDRFARLEEIDLDRLKADGVRALLLDADNTLGLWQDPAPSQGALRLVRAAKQAGFSLIIVSNAGAERLQPLSKALDIPFMPRCGKPLPFGLLRAARALGLSPQRCAMVGDQLLTDMPAAFLCGARRVLVDPLDTSREFGGTRINRRIERLLKRLFRL